MSSPERRNDLGDSELGSESEELDITFQTVDCFDFEHIGVSILRDSDGDIVPGSLTPFGVDQFFIDRAIEAAANATGAEARRPRIPPVRPPRTPQEIHTWEELLEPSGVVLAERERQAAEITSSCEIDNEPDRSTWPDNWGVHHDYFLWACRGTVPVITDHLQAIFCFYPIIEESFVAARLCGINAYKQMTFLQKYLPGETHTLQRAEARGVIYEVDISHPDVRIGSQKLNVEQLSPGNPEYVKPVLPCWAPSNWNRSDDAFAAMYLGADPLVFQREYGWTLGETPSIEFIRIRMAQIPHLNLTWQELQAAKDRRDFLIDAFPMRYPNEVPRGNSGFF
ncbi:hypothetical protein BJX76DRAFT_310145 [Aspergillus varians]